MYLHSMFYIDYFLYFFPEIIAMKDLLRVASDDDFLRIFYVIRKNNKRMKLRSVNISGCMEDINGLKDKITANLSGTFEFLMHHVNFLFSFFS